MLDPCSIPTDFTAQNKYVQRPTHPFTSKTEIIQAIPPDAKFVCKLDAVHGYFQLALDEKFSRPMGLNASSDELCRQTNVITSYAMKIVDNTIIWAKNEKELKERATG